MTVEDLMEKVMPEPNTGCWLWTGTTVRPSARGKQEYGTVSVKTEKGWRNRYAHRLLYEMLIGPIPEGHHLHHICETGVCVNPSHARLMAAREHARIGPNVKLKREDVEEIRAEGRDALTSINSLAQRYGVTTRQIYSILVGEKWK